MSSSSAANDDSLSGGPILELPDGRDFDPPHITLPIDVVLQACEEQLPAVNRDPNFEAERLRTKVDVPFEL
ncbi:MAG TPA: hypothetical protein VGE41_10760 [Verrucomicrobiae bacterium]|jgi:hypothetical protein